jgi:cytochrome c peroxidase
MSIKASNKATWHLRGLAPVFPLALLWTGIALLALGFAFLLPKAAMAQQATNFGSSSGVACPGGNVMCNGSINFLTTELFFEPETPFASLKEGPPTWNETEQLLDNPYVVRTGCTDFSGPLPQNDQGFPAYCTDGTFVRRPSLGGVTLPPMLVHPLNQNPATGAEMRVLNPNYAGGTFDNTDVCYTLGTGCTPASHSINVTAGSTRVEDTEIDYDVAIGRKLPFCQVNPEPIPLDTPFNTAFDAETLTACGSDSGEPGATSRAHNNTIPFLCPTFLAGYTCEDNVGLPFPGMPPILGNRSSSAWYSSPAVPATNTIVGMLFQITHDSIPFVTTGTAIPVSFAAGFRLTDPFRGVILPRNIATGIGGLRKPSLRIADVGGNGTAPNYLWNSVANLTARGEETLAPSNENDYVGLYGSGSLVQQKQNARLEAMRLGKSLFWDQQVGSDAVQACGSCHAHAAADNRTKNQINPNGQDGIAGNPTNFTPNEFTFPPNHDLTIADFPFHKLNDPEIAGDPLCDTPIIGNVAGISFPDGDPPVHPFGPIYTACDKANIISDTDDVASSMGVHFGRFFDIPAIGSFGAGSAIGGVKSVLPDLRSPVAADNVDPIPGFAGTDGSGNQFRRVEPRNTPTIDLADFNFDNFWDGRARHDDNGGSVFGPADPQAHVWVNAQGQLVATRQMIKFSSLGSLAKGPGLSKFEMSFDGRNWAKVAKKLLQAGVTPLANQLVDPTDGILGPYSNQNGSACATLPAADRSPAGRPPTVLGAGVPGLCISYPALIRHAFYSALHSNTGAHLNGCYTDGRPDIHPNQCGTGIYPAAVVAVLDPDGVVREHNNDPFDQFVLTAASGPAAANDTNQFTQMEGNFSLFWGQSIHVWASILVPDDTPWDQFLDKNPDSGGFNMGETGEPLLVLDIPNCPAPAGYVRDSNHGSCFTEVGNFKRDNNLTGTSTGTTVGPPGSGACIAQELVAGVRQCSRRVAAPGTRVPGSNQPDPLLGMDIFFGSNLSLKNPQFRSGRCGACHNAPTLTDNTTPFTHKTMLVDPAPEFERGNPVFEPLLEPLGHQRIISGFLLESEINGPGQDAIERKIVNESIVPAPVAGQSTSAGSFTTNGNCITDTCSGYSFPDAIRNDIHEGGAGLSYRVRSDLGSGPVAGPGDPVPFTSFGGSFFDNGVYNIGVRPCVASQSGVIGACEDNGRGNTDAFGWPLSLAALLMKNLGGPAQQPGTPLATFDPSAPATRADEALRGDCAPFCGQGGLWTLTGHDQQINPGYGDEEANPLLPSYLAPFASRITVGDSHPQLDEAGGPVGGMVNTLTDVANAEGLVELPFDPRAHLSEVINRSYAPGDATNGGPGQAFQGTWPVVNRVSRFGSFKAPQLREVELTGPYFHNGGKLTLRQVVDFYVRGGDFPVTNSQHRDFNILNLNAELQSNLSEEEKVALVDFLLELTDARVRFERPPFDHPELIIPLDGTAPENGNFGGVAFRDAQLVGCVASPLGPGQRACNNGMFLDIPATGAAGASGPIPNFLNISSGPRLRGADANCAVANNQYCH